MREDMAQVIVERPRIKPFKTRKGRRVALDELPQHEGMRRGHAERGDTKQLNDTDALDAALTSFLASFATSN